MLKINLLPIKAARRAQIGKRQLLLFVAIVVVFAAILTLVHVKYVRQDTTELSRRLQALKDETRSIKARTGDVSKYKRRRKKYKRRRKAFRQVLGGCYCRCTGEKKLIKCTQKCPQTKQMKRYCPGPVLVMRELSRILSERWGPTLKRKLKESRRSDYYNPNWDPTALWVTGFEEQHRAVKIFGRSKAAGDAYEFKKRLDVSRYFANVRLERTTQGPETKEKMTHYLFEITARALY